jgi:hypothetical protein
MGEVPVFYLGPVNLKDTDVLSAVQIRRFNYIRAVTSSVKKYKGYGLSVVCWFNIYPIVWLLIYLIHELKDAHVNVKFSHSSAKSSLALLHIQANSKWLCILNEK